MQLTREEVQSKAKEIGHCVCSKLFTCPCKFFVDKSVCKCAGEDVDYLTWLEYNK